MSYTNKVVKLKSKEGKLVQYREQSDLTLTILVKSQLLPNPIDIDELMTYQLTPVPRSLGTPDGFMDKTNKATLMHHLTDSLEDAKMPPAGETLYIEDGNAVIHALNRLPPTFKETVYRIVKELKSKTNCVFSTDSYLEGSVKSQELLR